MSSLSEEDSHGRKSWIEICDSEYDRTEDSAPHLKNDSDNPLRKEKPADKAGDNLFRMNETIEEGEILDTSSNTTIKSEDDYYDVKLSSRETNNVRNDGVKENLSYAQILQSKSPTVEKKAGGLGRLAVTDDLSLTSHLDVFHMVSPAKCVVKSENQTGIMIDEDTVMYSPRKNEENNIKQMKRPFNLIDSPVSANLSSSKGYSPAAGRANNADRNPTRKIAKSAHSSDVHSAIDNANDENDSTSYCSEDGPDQTPNKKRELELNPETISRRQKQIDYGKNTLGYDRYLKTVPKHKRTKDHPKTPPKHLKMSRRAWDGLVKNWRLKLHRYDPVTEKDEIDFDNVNFDQYSFSSDEPSSYDSSSVQSDSNPSTPKAGTSQGGIELIAEQWSTKLESSKELWSDCTKNKVKSDDDEFLGCEPLSEHCVNAYS